MNLQALQLLKQAETFIDSQSWKFYMSSWKHTPIFIRKIGIFVMFWGSKGPKLLLNALFGPQVHALDSILPTVNIESGLKGFYTVCGGQHSKWCQSERKINILESPKTVFFFKSRGHFTKERDRFLIFNRKTYKNDTLTTSKPSLCQISADVHKTGPHFHSLNIFCINSFLNRTF